MQRVESCADTRARMAGNATTLADANASLVTTDSNARTVNNLNCNYSNACIGEASGWSRLFFPVQPNSIGKILKSSK